MKTVFIGQNCIKLNKISSTNSYLAKLAEETNSVFEGTVVVASSQDQGRGQRGTQWISTPGENLTLSILLKPRFIQVSDQFLLNMAVALALHDCVSQQLESVSSKKTKVKWPNDIYINDKKCAGILIENILNGERFSQTIVGIGLNVNQTLFPDSLTKATSLALECGVTFSLNTCFELLCSCVEKRYLQLKSNPFQISSDYLKHLYRYGQLSEYRYCGGLVTATITGVEKSGRLVLKIEKGAELSCDIKELEFL